jgi:hypothetical protein
MQQEEAPRMSRSIDISYEDAAGKDVDIEKKKGDSVNNQREQGGCC